MNTFGATTFTAAPTSQSAASTSEHLVRLGELTVLLAAKAALGHEHGPAQVSGLAAWVDGRMDTRLGSTDSIYFSLNSGTNQWEAVLRTKPGGGLLVDGAGLAADVGVGADQVAAGNHTHDSLHAAVTVGNTGTVQLSLDGQALTAAARAGTGILATDSGVAADFGTAATQVARGDHTHTELTLAHAAVTVAATGSVTLTLNGQALTAAVRAGAGLQLTDSGVELNFGAGHDQPARGDHTHAGGGGGSGHNPVTLLASETLTLAISADQVLRAEVACGEGLRATASGVALDLGDGNSQAARGTHTHALLHAAVTMDDSASIEWIVAEGQNFSAAVKLNPAPPAGYGTLAVVGSGLGVCLGSGVNQAAMGAHTHALATSGVDGLMSKELYRDLQALLYTGTIHFQSTVWMAQDLYAEKGVYLGIAPDSLSGFSRLSELGFVYTPNAGTHNTIWWVDTDESSLRVPSLKLEQSGVPICGYLLARDSEGLVRPTPTIYVDETAGNAVHIAIWDTSIDFNNRLILHHTLNPAIQILRDAQEGAVLRSDAEGYGTWQLLSGVPLDASLLVAHRLRVMDSGVALGMVLTADANGYATWQNLSGVSGTYLLKGGDTMTGGLTVPSLRITEGAGAGLFLASDAAGNGLWRALDLPLLFVSEMTVTSGVSLGGRYRFTGDVQPVSASVVCDAPVGDPVVFTLEVDGALTAHTLTVAAGDTSAESDLSTADPVPSGQYLRWQCTSAPAHPEDAPSQVHLTMNVRPI